MDCSQSSSRSIEARTRGGHGRQGLRDNSSRSAPHRVTNNPIFRGAEPLSWRAGNLEALLDIRRSLLGQLPSNSQVERRSGLSRQEFHEEYYIRNRPVIVTDLVKQWPAFHLWCPAYLREK